MTTLEPGAREVLTHGGTARPRSTARAARSPAATITDGFDVLVQLVMAAMTTDPWSTSKLAPPASRTGTGEDRSSDSGARPGAGASAAAGGSIPSVSAGGSLAGKERAEAWSWLPLGS